MTKESSNTWNIYIQITLFVFLGTAWTQSFCSIFLQSPIYVYQNRPGTFFSVIIKTRLSGMYVVRPRRKKGRERERERENNKKWSIVDLSIPFSIRFSSWWPDRPWYSRNIVTIFFTREKSFHQSHLLIGFNVRF